MIICELHYINESYSEKVLKAEKSEGKKATWLHDRLKFYSEIFVWDEASGKRLKAKGKQGNESQAGNQGNK